MICHRLQYMLALFDPPKKGPIWSHKYHFISFLNSRCFVGSCELITRYVWFRCVSVCQHLPVQRRFADGFMVPRIRKRALHEVREASHLRNLEVRGPKNVCLRKFQQAPGTDPRYPKTQI